jgi:UDP-2-acetamido-2,6-beta-L-arabino-hexul-4-ose reductase
MDKNKNIVNKVLVTGSKGFVGKNLCAMLRRYGDIELYEYDVNSKPEDLAGALGKIDYIIHLAGVNRPKNIGEFEVGNAGLLKEICLKLRALGGAPKIILSSSIQAKLDNPYGVSKRLAEEVLQRFSTDTGAECIVYRFKNLFGKWCRPNYNSVTATFCHNIANDLPIQISDPSYEIELTYIDDVVEAFTAELSSSSLGFSFAEPLESVRVTLGELAEKIQFFKNMRTSLYLPVLDNAFDRALYGTYLSYLSTRDFEYGLEKRSDQRGSLAEFLKSSSMGQIFVSRIKPGATRGDHYHHTKTEKFFVLQGCAIIRFRHIEDDQILEYKVQGEDYRVLDIPPGYTHSIENVGEVELVTLFWASEIFDPGRPDTYFEKV